MAEFEEKLNSILGNQEAMGQIMALARSLSGEDGEKAPERGKNEHQDPPIAHPSGGAGEEANSDLSNLFSGLDPGTLQMGLRLFREYQSSDDRRTALLQALRPFLREERRERLDRAVRIARMTRLIRAILGAMGEKGDEEGV